MSLTPTNLFNVGSSAIPTLFLEARVHGGGGAADEIISQLGLTLTSNQVDVALFTRTSGIVLMAGVGSYCAYRICAKYLGKEFVWTLIDATRLDRLSRADSRLLHPAAEGYLTQNPTFYEERARKRLCQLLRSLSEDDKAISAGGLSVLGSSGRQSPAISHAGSTTQKPRYRLVSTRSGSPIRVVCTSNQLLRRSFQKHEQQESSSGLGAIRHWARDEVDAENQTLNTRKHVPLITEDDQCDAMSDLTSISRVQPPPDALLKTNCCTDVDGDLIEEDDENDDNWSRSSCLRSMGGEPLSWDDEFHRDSASVTNPLFSCGSSSDISELSAIKNLEAMWAKDNRRGTIDSSATSLILRLANDRDDTSSCCGTQNLAALIESKCSIQSTSYMYKSVHVDETDDFMHDDEDNQSVLSAGFTAKLVKDSQGLWEFSASHPKIEKNLNTVMLQPPDEPSTSKLMTESYKSSSSSKSQKRSMFDSAIGTDFYSDDDKSSLHGHTTKGYTDELKTPLSRPIAKRSSWLDKISEKGSPSHKPRRTSVVSSIAPSERSLEWFDDLKQKRPCPESEEGTPL